MQAKKHHKLSIQEYMDIMVENNQKYEYHDGDIFAMVGGTYHHGLICGNIFAGLSAELLRKGADCFPLNSDIKLYIVTENVFVFPDVMVVCEEVEKSEVEPESVTNPKVIVEVLSKSTESYDRGDKFYFYRKIPTLCEYILVSQDKHQVEVFLREQNNMWSIKRYQGKSGVLHISTLGINIDFEQIYRNVIFKDNI